MIFFNVIAEGSGTRSGLDCDGEPIHADVHKTLDIEM